MFLTVLLLITNLMGTGGFKEPSTIKSVPAIGPNTKQEVIVKSSATQSLVWDELKSLTQTEKGNILINIELLDKTNIEAKQLSLDIEKTWAEGNYNLAFELFENLARVINPSLIELGIAYKNPLTQGNKWSGDIRIGTTDSLNHVCLDFESDSSRLFAVVASDERTTRRYEIHRSTDGGANWVLTQAWISTVTDAYRDMDLVVTRGFLFVADIIGNNVRVRRYPTSTGVADSTRTVFTGTTSDSCYDVAITSDIDQYPTAWWLYITARIGGNIYAMRSTDKGLTWDNQATLATDAIGRVDICFAQNSGLTDLYVPYFRPNDSLYVSRNTNLGSSAYWQTPVNTGGTRINSGAHAWPSVAAFGDTALVVYEQYYDPNDNDILYALTTNSGISWSGSYVFSTVLIEGYPNVTGRKGKGWAAVCVFDVGATCRIRFRNSVPPYSNPIFTNSAYMNDSIVRYNVCPAIEYCDFPTPRWGVVYSSFTPYEWAWFDYNSTGTTGMVEISNNNITTSYYLKCFPNPSRSPKIEFEIPVASKVNVSIYDIKGSMVRNLMDKRLEPGRKLIFWNGKDEQGNSTAQGIYFVKLTTETGCTIKKLLMLY